MIFVDTSFWVAIRNQVDPKHTLAIALLRRHDGKQLLTTNHVSGETWTFIRRRLGHAKAAGFLDFLDRSDRLVHEHVDEVTEVAARAWLREHDEREYSFVDATSFALMRRLGIEEAFAFDEDFSAAGFVELRT